MISSKGNRSFLAAHYDWLVVGVGVMALLAGVGFYFVAGGENAEDEAAAAASGIESLRPSECRVKPVAMETYDATVRLIKTPKTVPAVSEKDASFLASERRVQCAKCKKAISPDVRAVPVCPYCGEKRQEEVKVVLDADNDGLPDEWEKRIGLNPANPADAQADADGDGFTNLEEFQAKTDPMNAKDHPDYLDSLRIELPLNETKMPLAFVKANRIPGGWRCEFVDPVRRNDYGRTGRKVTAKVGEEVVDRSDKKPVEYGFTIKSYTPKSIRRKIAGSNNKKEVDVSEVVLVRKIDGKEVTLVVQDETTAAKKLRLAPLDVQAKVRYERGSMPEFLVVLGSEITLSGAKYRVSMLKSFERGGKKGAQIEFEDVLLGRKRVIEALEP